MRIVLRIDYFGDAEYRFFAEAEWITMPLNRFSDSFGIAVQNLTPIINSINGYYTWDMDHYRSYPYSSNVTKQRVDFDPDDVGLGSKLFYCVDGRWDGIAARIDLPIDAAYNSDGLYESIINYNLKIVFAFRAIVSEPDASAVFNVSARYDHKILVPMVNFSIAMATDGVSSSCALDTTLKDEPRIVYTDVPITYVP